MDPIKFAIEDLARAGVIVTRADFPLGELYEAPGYPELTRNQVFALASQIGVRDPASAP